MCVCVCVCCEVLEGHKGHGGTQERRGTKAFKVRQDRGATFVTETGDVSHASGQIVRESESLWLQVGRKQFYNEALSDQGL